MDDVLVFIVQVVLGEIDDFDKAKTLLGTVKAEADALVREGEDHELGCCGVLGEDEILFCKDFGLSFDAGCYLVEGLSECW